MIEANILYGLDNDVKIKSLLEIVNSELEDFYNEKLIIFNKDAWYVIVEESKHPVGLGALVKKNSVYYIDFVYVLKDKRKNNYGDLIVKMLLDKGFRINAKQIYTTTNPSVKEFFLKIGFKQINQKEMVVNEDGVHKCNH